ncbi:M81 family metallopeptidase [Hypericibacter sp.]|uniref:M81 family metallopeptidase n=1 Tax=Hypericibacter sp. TaxID=2705401 RepID=UPI003D6C77CB
MARLAIGGFVHETNTFAPTKARFEHFAMADGWPALVRGEALVEAVKGINLPAAGFVEATRGLGHELVPLTWCSATPLAHVEREAYERIAGMLLDDIKQALPLDGLYLDLHGAMVAEHLEDGEGELLKRIRALVGDKLPIVVGLDLHANVTEAMVRHATALVAFRTYPHVDMAETGARAARLLDRLIGGTPCFRALRKAPFLIPLTWQCTLIEPAASIYRRLEELEQEPGVLSLSFTPGFPPADIRECGPAVIAQATTQAAADRAADLLEQLVEKSEPAFAGRLWKPDEAVAEAMVREARSAKPVILADTQDNPGAGTNSDTTGVFAALVRAHARDAVVGLVCDPESAARAHDAGEGAVIEIGLGNKSGLPGLTPYEGRFRVERLGSGSFTATGPFYLGSRMQLGPMALLEHEGVRVVVSSRKQQAADRSMFRHVGIEPERQKILALKSSVHFRADFQAIAEEILVVASPGPNPADHLQLPYKHLRPGLRLMPLGPAFASPER